MVKFACFLFFIGCSTIDIKKPGRAEAIIKRDLVVTVNDVAIRGAGVVQRASRYKISADLKEKYARVVLSTCHREVVWHNISKIDFAFSPAFLLENIGSCIMQIEALRIGRDPQSAIIDFTDGEQLTAQLDCNGSRTSHKGTSICQSRAGTVQRWTFDQPVNAKAAEGCPEPVSDSGGYDWTIDVGEGFCIYMFELNDQQRHRATTFGYNALSLDFVE